MKIATPTKAQVEMTIRAKAFAGDTVREHRVLVDDVSVRVYDSTAGHFTLCHSLSKATVRKIIAKAGK